MGTYVLYEHVFSCQAISVRFERMSGGTGRGLVFDHDPDGNNIEAVRREF
jgi:hypothetical protein